MRGWGGLPGTWATSCNAEASTSNWVLTFYSDRGGRALRRADRGAAEPSLLSVVDSAQVPTPTTFLMRIRNADASWGSTNGDAYDTVIEITPSGMRTLASTRITDGKQLIKDGKLASNGSPAALLQRCR